MLRRCVLFVENNLHKSRTRLFVDNTCSRQIHCGICFRTPRHTSKTNSGTTPALSSKYRVITDLDLNDNIESIYENEDSKYPVLSDEFDDINLTSMLRKLSNYYNFVREPSPPVRLRVRFPLLNKYLNETCVSVDCIY